MNRLFSLLATVVFSIFIAFHSSFAMATEDEALANAQRTLDAAFADAAARYENTTDLRFAFTTRVETGDKDNPLIEFSFDPQKPDTEQYDFIHPSAEENAKERGKILKQRRKTIEKRRKSGEIVNPDRDLLMKFSRAQLSDTTLRLLRETDTEYVFSINMTSFDIRFGNSGEDDHKKGNKKEKKENNGFAKHMSGEIAVGKDNHQFRWMRVFSTAPFKPVAVARIKEFDMRTTLAPAWPDGPLVKVRQEIKVSGKAMFRKFDQHSVIESFAFEKR